MLAQWTGEIVGKMHIYEVSAVDLAAEAGWNPKYMSAVLNCKRTPKNAENTLRNALAAIIARKDGA